MVRVREFALVAAVAFGAMGAAATLDQNLFQQPAEVIAQKTFVVQPAFAVAHLAETLPRSKTSAIAQFHAAFVPPAAVPLATVQLAQLTTPNSDSQAAVAPPKPELRVAASDNTPLLTSDTADLANAVALRVRDSVPSNLFPYFDVYLYVSKAAAGPWAQHMFIFHRAPDRHLVFEQSVPVSTGRERHEKYFTSTPTGLFELDPNRFDRNHHSRRWNNAPMPWAMFLDYTIHNHLAGVALHSGIGHVQLLGQRASGGCVRLPPETAQMLFKRFQTEEHGMVPRLAFNDTHSTTLTDGTLELGADGQPLLVPGYKVLLIIQDYPGGPELVAELS